MKHEYDDGEIFGMPGGSRRHNALASRISAALETARKPGCVVLRHFAAQQLDIEFRGAPHAARRQ